MSNMFSKALAAAGLLASFAIGATTTTSVPTISVSGAKFFYSNGTQYFYQGYAAPLLTEQKLIIP